MNGRLTYRAPGPEAACEGPAGGEVIHDVVFGHLFCFEDLEESFDDIGVGQLVVVRQVAIAIGMAVSVVFGDSIAVIGCVPITESDAVGYLWEIEVGILFFVSFGDGRVELTVCWWTVAVFVIDGCRSDDLGDLCLLNLSIVLVLVAIKARSELGSGAVIEVNAEILLILDIQCRSGKGRQSAGVIWSASLRLTLAGAADRAPPLIPKDRMHRSPQFLVVRLKLRRRTVNNERWSTFLRTRRGPGDAEPSSRMLNLVLALNLFAFDAVDANLCRFVELHDSRVWARTLIDDVVGGGARKQGRLASVAIIALEEVGAAHDAEDDEREERDGDRGIQVDVEVGEAVLRPAQYYKTKGAENWGEGGEKNDVCCDRRKGKL